MSDVYELRCAAYLHVKFTHPAWHGSIDLRQWNAYSCETDGDTREWQDRANKEDCWRDWWDADWIDPEEDE
jgi:hypothetical protein